MEEKTYTLPGGDEIMVIFGFEEGEEVVEDIYGYEDCNDFVKNALQLFNPGKNSVFLHSVSIEEAWEFIQDHGIDNDEFEDEWDSFYASEFDDDLLA